MIGCGASSSLPSGSGAGGQGAGGQGGSGGSAQCAHDPPGKPFKFHFHNQGMRSLNLAYGCGSFPPLFVDTATGKLPLSPSPGSQTSDGLTCDAIFAGAESPGVYSDCGPGYGASFGPGATVDLDWDRRGYDHYFVPPACSGHPTNNDCWLGHAIPASNAQKGALTICKDGAMSTFGYCNSPEVVQVTFDTTGDEATVEIQ
jgi:hypothetical protein